MLFRSLSERMRRALLARYKSDAGNPFADEIIDWLKGAYAFDPISLIA